MNPDSSSTSSFRDLGLADDLVAALNAAGITDAFPVQTATLPDALAGRDVCGMAPTGSGKTLAYGLAVVQRVARASSGRPRALILVPTRELAIQVAGALMPYARVRGRWVTAVFGGAAMMRQIDDLRRGVDIMVATPGRLTDLMMRGAVDLGDVEYVVVDEADRMADMGFTPQVTYLLDRVAAKRQVLLFSATLDGDVKTLIDAYLHDPVHHRVEGQHTEEDEADALARAPHYRVAVRHETKMETIAELAAAARRSVVFVKNRFATERTADQITDLGVRSAALHGGMTQSARQNTVLRWARGDVKALVATDVAARGLHVDGLDLVVHLDPPQDEKDYVHRSGRTARAGGRGVVVNLVRKEQQRASLSMFRRLGVETSEASVADVVRELEEIVATAPPIEVPKERERDRERPGRGYEGGRSRDDRGGRTGREAPYGRDGASAGNGRGSSGYRNERPGSGRPSFDRPGFDRPGFDRPGFDRPGFDRTERPYGDRPSRDRSTGERPYGNRPFGDRPSGDRPFGERPFGDRPVIDRPFGDRTAGERPGYGRSGGDRPVGDRSFADRGHRDDRSHSTRGDRPAYARNDRGAVEFGPGDRGTEAGRDSGNERSWDPTSAGSPRNLRPGVPSTDRAPWGDRPTHARPERRGDDQRPAAPSRDGVVPARAERFGRASLPDVAPSIGDRAGLDRAGLDRAGLDHGTDSGESTSTSTPSWAIRERATASAAPGTDAERRSARFDEHGQPLNRRARRQLAYGGA